MPSLAPTPSLGGLQRTRSIPAQGELSALVAAFESARGHGPADLAAFLPPAGNPLRLTVLIEFIRIDLEAGWSAGRPTPLADYARRFPEAFRNPDARGELAFEEYRQRVQAGQDPDPSEYARQLGVNVAEWPTPAQMRTATVAAKAEEPRTQALGESDADRFAAVAREYHAFRQQADGNAQWDRNAGDRDGPTRLFRELHEVSPEAALRLAEAAAKMPSAGSEFAGFRLVSELGRGAFGRVFLAEQKELAGRPVALKVSVDVQAEARALAQLLHTNVVPIYSIHRVGPFQAVCMPFCGRTTLSDVLRRYRGETVPDSGKHPGDAPFVVGHSAKRGQRRGRVAGRAEARPFARDSRFARADELCQRGALDRRATGGRPGSCP
jgi:hypothetical protein